MGGRGLTYLERLVDPQHIEVVHDIKEAACRECGPGHDEEAKDKAGGESGPASAVEDSGTFIGLRKSITACKSVPGRFGLEAFERV